MSPPRLLFRADASAAIGMGHAMRCLALAEAYRGSAGGRSVFLMASPLPAFASRAQAGGAAGPGADGAGAEVRALVAPPGSAGDVRETLATAADVGAGWIVLDGYEFDGGFQAAVVDAGHRVLALDDYGHGGRYHAQLVLNQNAGADPAPYADRAPATRLLLGPRFALLREEFRNRPARRRPAPARARRVVVTLGGSDPDNVSARVLEGLAAVPGPLEIVLLVGPANPHRAVLEREAAACLHRVQVVTDVRDMAKRLAWADLAVAAAGSTVLELACVGTPQVLIVLADNQAPGAAAMARDGLAVSLGRQESVAPDTIAAAVAALAEDAARRNDFSRRSRELVDGQGTTRVLAAMELTADAEVAA
ncbi:MAG TPA: UDP-2,4-diacetamido-2,4,6-trideoxy-beta-L-altropyranose hydrolase [Solirubrobacteraceae bacterium]|nr:UDP-2,4-diacetamido-2,4,6-trideoxy-beta-L-altropyranose hydrolase [Solirubrobacteraceae bacterium]